jgi:hypothetical protein
MRPRVFRATRWLLGKSQGRLEVVEDTTDGLEGGAEGVDHAGDEAVDAADEAAEEGLERGEKLADDGDGGGLSGEGLDDALHAGEDGLELARAARVSRDERYTRGHGALPGVGG